MKYGGIETMLINIANEQVNHADIYIICVNDFYDQSLLDLLDGRVKLIKIGRPLGNKNPYYILKLNYTIWKIRPNIIHSHAPSLSRYIVGFSRMNSLITIHAIPQKSHLDNIHYYKRLASISHSVYNCLKEKGYDSTIIANGIITQKFKKRTTVITTNNRAFRIIVIGRLSHKEKGQDLLIEACDILIKQNICNILVDFIGAGESEEYLKNMVDNLCLNNYITFIGPKSPLYIQKHLKDYDLFIQPSRIEGFGLTVAEAMAAKVPVLVSGQEGPMEIIDNGKYGFYFQNENVKQLADKIIEIMNMNSTELSSVTNDALDRVEKYYSVQRTANEYISLYKSMIV